LSDEDNPERSQGKKTKVKPDHSTYSTPLARVDFFIYAPLLWKLRHEIDDRIEPVLLVNGKDESGFLQGILQTGLVI